MERIVGIDLGTTNSCVAVLEGGQASVIHNRQGGRTLPSVVAIDEQGDRLVGSVAARQAIMNPAGTIRSVKRLIGRKFSDPSLAAWKEGAGCTLCPADNGDAWIELGGRAYSPSEISAMILEEVKLIAEDYLGEQVTSAVITVPAYFDDNQRQATKDAGRIAGLEVKKIINEPTAAALGYGLSQDKEQTFAVFDLGGGTFDVTILRTGDGVFEVLSSGGDSCLGGNDFDHNLLQHLITQFERDNGRDLRDDPCAVLRLREEAERAKCELSVSLTSSINLPYITDSDEGPLHLIHDPLERRLFERLNEELLQRLEGPCRAALEEADLGSEELDQVILVGGMTRAPVVQEAVRSIFGVKPAKDVNPDEIVAIGAATQSAILAGKVEDVVLLDVTSHSLGIRVVDDRMSVVIPRSTTIPTSEKKLVGTTADNQDFVEIEVYQGESPQVADNTHLGCFTLAGLPRKRAGEVHVEVNFLIDADGVVDVSAREVQTGKQTSVRIDPASGLTAAQLKKLTSEHRALAGR